MALTAKAPAASCTARSVRVANRTAIIARVASVEKPMNWTEKYIKDVPVTLLRPGVDTEDTIRAKFEKVIRDAQDSICAAISEIDGQPFHQDAWTREDGGGGITRVLADGNVWEKAGVNVSVVYGSMPPEAYRAAAGHPPADLERAKAAGGRVPFFAAGISSVMHPRNPHCPTMHFNYRFFQTEDWNGIPGQWWFGGGTDITPIYVVEEDMKHFHGTYKAVCDRHDPEFYPKFKKWCDEYFLISHRKETRGLGGIFFDDLNDREPEKILAFAKDAVNHVVEAYTPIVKKHMNDPFTEDEKRWQQIRRGRSVQVPVHGVLQPTDVRCGVPWYCLLVLLCLPDSCIESCRVCICTPHMLAASTDAYACYM
eukprot:GHUV01004470.1.p1 GENE.GHUV01004470.1~~GHUV01004470.1.p1  ORF type:complete len:368 (+),score=97.16 GHUV01004470.1:232-1335(+)